MKYKLIIKLFIATVFLVCMSEYTYSQNSYFNIYAPFVGARAASLAEADMADAYDANIMYWNPAALTNLKHYSLSINHSQEKQINGVSECIAVPFRLGYSDVLAIGLVINHTGYYRKNKNAEFKVIQYGYDVAYAKEVFPTVSLGANVGIRYARSTVTSVWIARSSIGLFYSPSQEISYGIVYNGLGNGLGYSLDGISTRLYSTNPPHSLQVGLALRFPTDTEERLFSIAVANEKVFGQKGILYKGGIECFFARFFAMRVGYSVNDDQKTATYGCGFITNPIKLDISISPNKKTNQAIFVSLLINFGNN